MDNTKVIELQSFGILPDTEDDYTEKLNKLFRENPENTVFITVPLHGVSMQ